MFFVNRKFILLSQTLYEKQMQIHFLLVISKNTKNAQSVFELPRAFFATNDNDNVFCYDDILILYFITQTKSIKSHNT